MRVCFALALMLFSTELLHAQGDWQVTTSPSAKLAYKHNGLYGGIKTQEAWDKEFKKVFEKGDVAASRFLILHAKKNELTFDVNALLQKSVTLKTSAMTQMLLAQGADPSAKDSSGNQALHLAVKTLSTQNVELLLRRTDVDVNAENGQGERSIGLAVASNNEQVVKQVLKRRPDLDFKLWGTDFKEWVLKKDNVEGFKVFYADLNARKLPLDDEGQTILHKAAKYNASRITMYLLKKGANTRVPAGKVQANDAGHLPIPFEYAVTSGHVNTIRAYLEHDKKFVHYRDPKGHDTLMQIAFETGNWELADLVLKFNPDFALGNEKGEYLGDTLKRVKETSDPKDVEGQKSITKYETLLSNKKATSEKILAHAMKYNDTASLEKHVKGLSNSHYSDLAETFISLTDDDQKKIKLFKAILKHWRSRTQSPWNYVATPDFFNPKNFLYFKAVYETLGDEGLYYCDAVACPLGTALIEGGPPLVKLMSKLKPPLNFNRTYSYSEYSDPRVTGYYQSYLDYLDHELERIKPTSSHSRIKTLTEMRSLLVKQGAFTREEQDAIAERAAVLIRTGRGKDLLKQYKPEKLAHIAQGAILSHAIFYNDENLVKALLPHHRDYFYGPAAGTFAGTKTQKILTAAGIKLNHPINCADYFAYYDNPIHHEQLIKILKQTQLSLCQDSDALLTYAIYKNSEPLISALLELPTVAAKVKKPNSKSALHVAVHECDLATTKKLLTIGADPNFDFMGAGVPLRTLAGRNKCKNIPELAAELIKKGADVNAVTESDSLIRTAMITKNVTAFKILIEAGAKLYRDPNNTTRFPISEIEFLASQNRSEYQDFWEILEEKNIDPVRTRQCRPWTDTSFTYSSNKGPFDILNNQIIRFREKQRTAQNESSCESIKGQIEAEYTRDILIFNDHVEKWKQVAKTYRSKYIKNSYYGFDNDVAKFQKLGLPMDRAEGTVAYNSLCCGYSELSRCLSQTVCDDKQPERDSSAVFCDRFANTPMKVREMGIQIKHVNFKELKAEAKNLINKHDLEPLPSLHFAVADEFGSPNDPVFEFIVPLHLRRKGQPIDDNRVIDKIIDEQIPHLYAKMSLDSLHSYVAWKYPHCSDRFPVGSKVSADKLNKTISPQKQNTKNSTSTEGTNAK